PRPLNHVARERSGPPQWSENGRTRGPARIYHQSMGRGRPGCINSPLIMVTEEKTALSPSNPAQHLTTDITIEAVAEQVRSWLQAARTRSVPAPAKLLSDLLRAPRGPESRRAAVARVIRPEDPGAAAVELRRLAQGPPRFLPAPLRRVVELGGSTSRVAPHLVV